MKTRLKPAQASRLAPSPEGVSAAAVLEPPRALQLVCRPATPVPLASPALQARVDLAPVLSPTQVRTFLDCSARWWFRHALELPELKTSSLALGSAVHRALEINFREKYETGEDLDSTGVVAIFREFWGIELERTLFQPEENPAELARLGERIVRKYMDEAAPRIQPAAVELEVTGHIAGVRVAGRVDLLDTQGRIIDLKTAARRPNCVSPDYAFQLATYRQITPGASGQARLDTLVRTQLVQLVTLEYTVGEQDLEATRTLYPLAQAGMRSGLYFPNRQSILCSRRNCPFWRECEQEFGGTVRNS